MKLLLYCTKAKPYLNDYRLMEYCNQFVIMSKPYNNLNGKIVAECDFEVEKIELQGDEINLFYGVEERAYLTFEQISNYLGYDNDYKGYAIHIKNLHIFENPRKLSDYYKIDNTVTLREAINRTKPIYIPINNAPQNMMYCFEDDGNHLQQNILISIKPEWLCKILNGEKTIEVRKKVLKEMLQKCL